MVRNFIDRQRLSYTLLELAIWGGLSLHGSVRILLLFVLRAYIGA